jgi:hypothetical protein
LALVAQDLLLVHLMEQAEAIQYFQALHQLAVVVEHLLTPVAQVLLVVLAVVELVVLAVVQVILHQLAQAKETMVVLVVALQAAVVVEQAQ